MPTDDTSTQIQGYSRIGEIVGYRDTAIQTANEGCALLVQGFALLEQAQALAIKASGGHAPWTGHTSTEPYKRLFQTFDGQSSFDQFRAHTDACVWLRLYHDTGMFALMDADARKALNVELSGNTPEVTQESAYDRMLAMHEERATIFRRGLANSFIRLDRRFKSHDPYQFSRRVILTHLFDVHGYSCRDSFDVLDDIERAFAVLDLKPNYEVGAARKAITDERHGGSGARQTLVYIDYFKIRVYMNGNVHLWFTREDLVERVNQELAAYYGAVLPDAVPTPEDNLRHKATTTALSKDLAFYPTPRKVIDEILNETLGHKLRDSVNPTVLEPSAGDGAIVRALLGYTSSVTAIEVDPDRYRKLAALQRQHPRMTALCANFLTIPARPTFDFVVMNPPFAGTHYVSHVMHAYGFLKPRGVLCCVLPATAQYSDHGDHAKFQAWVAERKGTFRDLPSESFKESGTRIHTCYLTLRK